MIRTKDEPKGKGDLEGMIFLIRHTSSEAADVTTRVARGNGCVPYNCIHPSR